ncbi:hypothetical protein D3C87_1787560 [compost metagenome]
MHGIVRYELRFSRHDRASRGALRQFVHRSYTIRLVLDVRNDHRFHEALDKGGLSGANGADYSKVDVSTGTFGNVLNDIDSFQHDPLLRDFTPMNLAS